MFGDFLGIKEDRQSLTYHMNVKNLMSAGIFLAGAFLFAPVLSSAEAPNQPGEIADFPDGKRLLYGGKRPSEAPFDVSDFRLQPQNLQFGLGREHFPALIEPQFVTASEAGRWLRDSDQVLGIKIGDDVKVYPFRVMLRHEVVNDVVGGRPVFAAHCVLANLGAFYDRRIGEAVFTFAVSGYTYSEPDIWEGRQAFVLWDRDTESLWLPTIGKAVSGPMVDVSLPITPRQFWTQTTWGEFRTQYPDALVLKSGQQM